MWKRRAPETEEASKQSPRHVRWSWCVLAYRRFLEQSLGAKPALKDASRRRRAALARREKKKTAAKTAVKPFEAAVITKLNSIQSALKTPMPPPNPDAAAATKSKPRGRKNQGTVPCKDSIAEATPRKRSSEKTVVRRAKDDGTPAPSRKVPTQVQSTYELRRRSTKYERDMEAALAASIAEAAALQAAGEHRRDQRRHSGRRSKREPR
ncbi:hypothetical protein MTO96_038005 [Rhipicephalus appendiculatus]